MPSDKWPPKIPQGFPLTVSERGYVKRIGSKLRWICGRKTPAEALAIYHRKAVALTTGRTPMPLATNATARPTLHWIMGKWLDQKLSDADAGELTHRAYAQYRLSARRIDREAGDKIIDEITPEWTQELYNRIRKLDKTDAAKRAIAHLRTAARFAEDMKWCGRVSLGNDLVKRLTSRPRASMNWRLYSPAEIRRILAASKRGIRNADSRSIASRVQLHAMILLAINGGYGAKELSDLPREVIDIDGARIDFGRGKTGARHAVPLWTETVAALRPVLDQRPGDALLFRTREGNPWCRPSIFREGNKLKSAQWIDNVNERFRELVEAIGLRIDGQGFYKLKHLHCTTADRAGDPHATFALAGHELPGSKSHYVKVDESRLRKVVDFVRHELLSRQSGPHAKAVVAKSVRRLPSSAPDKPKRRRA